MDMKVRPVVLCILDGWGEGFDGPFNSIIRGRTPNMERFKRIYPATTLETSGISVGLPEGQMGNSEVGHMTMGAGHVFMQDLPRIHQAIADGSFDQLPGLLSFIKECQEQTGVCHVVGMLSSGGVHGHSDHMVATCHVLARHGLTVYVHGFLDGRDVSPQSAQEDVDLFLQHIASQKILTLGKVHLATLSGRYYGMDRDQRWERTAQAFHTITQGGTALEEPLSFIQRSYTQGITDEFMTPSVVGTYPGINPNDGIFMTNFRADRVLQLLAALSIPSFSAFDRKGFCHQGPRLAMAAYSQALTPLWPPLFPPYEIFETLGAQVAQHGRRQLRLAETEKFAHVTYFLNGGKEEPFEGEDRILIPSPRVAHYNLQPEMSAGEITKKLIEAIASKVYDLIVVNYANADMVGHTGDFTATCQAIECLDTHLGEVEHALLAHDTSLFLTADHGNAEQMYDATTDLPHTAHTTNAVPAILVNPMMSCSLDSGSLQDVAPTLLELMGISCPMSMTGRSLIREPLGKGS